MVYRPRFSFDGPIVPELYQSPLCVLIGTYSRADLVQFPGTQIKANLGAKWNTISLFAQSWLMTHYGVAVLTGGLLDPYEALKCTAKVCMIVDTSEISAPPGNLAVWQQVLANRKAAGWKVIATTPIVLSNVWITDPTWINYYSTYRDGIRNNAIAWGADALVDLAADPNFSIDPATSPYFTSGSLNTAGAQHIGDLCSPVIETFYRPLPGP